MHTSSRIFRLGRLLLLAGGLALLSSKSWAQPPSFDGPALPGLWDVDPLLANLGSEPATAPTGRVPRIRLFRFAPGFLADPIGMQDEDNVLPGIPNMPGANLPSTAQDNGPDWIQFGMGSDNPYFDLRRPGDPGGIGYYRVNTQISLLDSPTTACALGVQTVTPTGGQFGGLQNGPTVVVPAFSVFHAVTDRLAVQGFVSKNVPISDASSSPSPLQRNVQYGVALQRPLVSEGPEGLRNLFFSVGALGQLTPDHDSVRLVSTYDVLPGFQWHVNDNWWLSSGLLLPLGPTRAAPGQWQLTCSLQF